MSEPLPSDNLRIAGLYIYPVKSCRGIHLDEIQLTQRGFSHDREWMVVRPDGTFLTQREAARLALVETVISAEALEILAPDHGGMRLDLKIRPGEVTKCEVVIWKERCPALDMGPDAAAWFTDFLGFRVRLVRFDPKFRRLSDPVWTGASEAENLFSDGFPILILSEESLADLNSRITGPPLTMERFRPNLVIAGTAAYGEDRMESLMAGTATFRIVKPCTRCVITNTDPISGVRGEEPLRTLETYRRDERLGGVTFGQNAIITDGVGDVLHTDMSLMAWGPG